MSISLAGLVKRFDGAPAVNGVSIDIPRGAFCVVLGPSGCGKSTLLRLIAGLEAADAGAIALEGRAVCGPGLHVAPEDRAVAVVFQSYALWPHMSVADNVAFPLRVAGLRGAALDRETIKHLNTVALSDLAARRPADLSGGQRQRVALARCLASGARTVLMDEPLANLDPHLRHRMESELAAFHAASGATTLYITHDQREAMALADLVAVMQDGCFLQIGPPETVYARPACEAVARFIGRGAILHGQRLDGEGIFGPLRTPSRGPDGPLTGLMRPSDVRLCDDGAPGRIAAVTYRGGHF
ncbi:MAG: ABC transporter ATP-binding protein, partial [Alphaproteobacteria bacterium HGW-Alphaproteobacteria-8]